MPTPTRLTSASHRRRTTWSACIGQKKCVALRPPGSLHADAISCFTSSSLPCHSESPTSALHFGLGLRLSSSNLRIPDIPKSHDLQIARAKEIKSHFVQKTVHETHDARKAAEKAATGVIVSLGLVQEDEGDKA